MSHPDLPSEILNLIVDFLYDEPETLGQCCLVSKSWVSRAQKHLFAVVVFHTPDSIKAWKRTFPEPSKSPAHHTRALTIECPEAITAADGAVGGLIPAFSRLVYLEVSRILCAHHGSTVDLTPFHKVPHNLKSLSVTSFPFPLLPLFDLIGSLPLLEDLSLRGSARDINDNDLDGPQTVVPSSTPPPFTGLLDICLLRGIAGAARLLLSLPNGLHFRELRLQWYLQADLRYIVQLVTACSDTLELLDVACMGKGAASFCWNGHLL